MCLGAGYLLNRNRQEDTHSFLALVSNNVICPQDSLDLAITKASGSPLDLNLSQHNSLRNMMVPGPLSFQTLGDLAGGYALSPDSDAKSITEYTVEDQDTISSVAEKFGISQETIIWANDLSKNSALKPGQNLIILPVSGVLYYVKAGDILSDIVKTYKADLDETVIYNELAGEEDIYVGDILIIPNGIKPKPVATVIEQVPLASSYFICPIASPCKITQGLHFSNAIDFSNGICGSPIYAAAAGQVLRIKYGYNNGAGNYLLIQHPNGVTTMYGHLQSVAVMQGDTVSQGQVIAYMGGQPGTPGAGNSTGCHVHFQVQGAKNPFAR
jgi:murein DD-endopeptidase MepM/ murein hydrolase activator NlpD